MSLSVVHSKPFNFNRADFIVSKNNILKALMVPPGKEDDYITSLIDEFIEKCLNICKPIASYILISNPKFVNKTTMHIAGQSFELDKIVLSAVKQSESIAFFIGTAGDGIEKLSKQLMNEGHALEGLICNLIGSEIAESVAEKIHGIIGEENKTKGLNCTNRYSPGYCNWPVSDQQKLFTLLNGNNCGVSLNESSLMTPIKSVSGIIGVGTEVKYRGYTCSKCRADHCIYRDKN